MSQFSPFTIVAALLPLLLMMAHLTNFVDSAEGEGSSWRQNLEDRRIFAQEDVDTVKGAIKRTDEYSKDNPPKTHEEAQRRAGIREQLTAEQGRREKKVKDIDDKLNKGN